jgi:hypothetical protein
VGVTKPLCNLASKDGMKELRFKELTTRRGREAEINRPINKVR